MALWPVADYAFLLSLKAVTGMLNWPTTFAQTDVRAAALAYDQGWHLPQGVIYLWSNALWSSSTRPNAMLPSAA
jgi:hypothetical protein